MTEHLQEPGNFSRMAGCPEVGPDVSFTMGFTPNRETKSLVFGAHSFVWEGDSGMHACVSRVATECLPEPRTFSGHCLDDLRLVSLIASFTVGFSSPLKNQVSGVVGCTVLSGMVIRAHWCVALRWQPSAFWATSGNFFRL